MGHTYAEVKLYNPQYPLKGIELKLIVDTGSTYTWIKRNKLTKLEVKPFTTRKFRTIKGQLIEREVGEAVVEYGDERATTMVVFGEGGDVEVLGVYALEGLGLEVDPTTGELRKSEAILAL
ncbi:MAG: aspartyl protease family protein [Candidatus Bathyarchaeia archaeon]